MKILITGASGFIGSKLALEICNRYAEDEIYLMTSKEINYSRVIKYDQKNYKISKIYFNDLSKIELLIHVGSFIPKINTDSDNIILCNGNIHFIENLISCPLISLRKIIFLSTVDVYATDQVISEQTEVAPTSLYGFSKLYCEQILSIYAKQMHVEYMILRIGHVYGPGEELFQKFLPKMINCVVNDAPIELWGDGSDVRTFIYIDDVVVAILNSIEEKKNIKLINIVGSEGISIKELIMRVSKISGKSPKIINYENNGNKRNYIFDNRLMKSSILSAETSMNEGLANEIAYFEKMR
jgi:UDP-glucose 4-epimerase